LVFRRERNADLPIGSWNVRMQLAELKFGLPEQN
jgi:hypothetical protein